MGPTVTMILCWHWHGAFVDDEGTEHCAEVPVRFDFPLLAANVWAPIFLHLLLARTTEIFGRLADDHDIQFAVHTPSEWSTDE